MVCRCSTAASSSLVYLGGCFEPVDFKASESSCCRAWVFKIFDKKFSPLFRRHGVIDQQTRGKLRSIAVGETSDAEQVTRGRE